MTTKTQYAVIDECTLDGVLCGRDRVELTSYGHNLDGAIAELMEYQANDYLGDASHIVDSDNNVGQLADTYGTLIWL